MWCCIWYGEFLKKFFSKVIWEAELCSNIWLCADFCEYLPSRFRHGAGHAMWFGSWYWECVTWKLQTSQKSSERPCASVNLVVRWLLRIKVRSRGWPRDVVLPLILSGSTAKSHVRVPSPLYMLHTLHIHEFRYTCILHLCIHPWKYCGVADRQDTRACPVALLYVIHTHAYKFKCSCVLDPRMNVALPRDIRPVDRTHM